MDCTLKPRDCRVCTGTSRVSSMTSILWFCGNSKSSEDSSDDLPEPRAPHTSMDARPSTRKESSPAATASIAPQLANRNSVQGVAERRRRAKASPSGLSGGQRAVARTSLSLRSVSRTGFERENGLPELYFNRLTRPSISLSQTIRLLSHRPKICPGPAWFRVM